MCGIVGYIGEEQAAPILLAVSYTHLGVHQFAYGKAQRKIYGSRRFYCGYGQKKRRRNLQGNRGKIVNI